MHAALGECCKGLCGLVIVKRGEMITDGCDRAISVAANPPNNLYKSATCVYVFAVWCGMCV